MAPDGKDKEEVWWPWKKELACTPLNGSYPTQQSSKQI